MIKKFNRLYPDSSDIRKTFCPYRVCPIGAHVDHQHGLVSGFAIDKGIDIIYSPTDTGVVELHSMNFEGKKQFHINNVPEKKGDWADYFRGATVTLAKKYDLNYGLHCLIRGSLPVGGLSSSAAVTLAFLKALCDVNGIALSDSELIETAYISEREYVGVNVGTLDQSCEVYCRKDALLFLDTDNGTYEIIPKNKKAKDFEIAIFFSGLERNLASSAFNMRVDEVKSAAYALKAFSGAEYGKFKDTVLRDVPYEVFEKYKDKLPENWRKRAQHFYEETHRVLQGVEAWREGNIEKLGALCTASGNSSITNWETGSEELKKICEIMNETEGIYGGRFSGAGFKGCCMALIDPKFKDHIRENMTAKYLEAFPQYEGKFSVHFCKTADGCTI